MSNILEILLEEKLIEQHGNLVAIPILRKELYQLTEDVAIKFVKFCDENEWFSKKEAFNYFILNIYKP